MALKSLEGVEDILAFISVKESNVLHDNKDF